MMINELTLKCNVEIKFDKTGVLTGIDTDINLTEEEAHGIEKILIKSFLNQLGTSKELSEEVINALKTGVMKKKEIVEGGNEHVRN